ncbi:MAG: hypothetical protein ACLFPW_10430 [Spirochaetaceae bacterium]
MRLVPCLLLSIGLIGCAPPSLTELPLEPPPPETEDLLIVYALGDDELSPHLHHSTELFLSAGELPAGVELLLFREIDGDRQLWSRSQRSERELSSEEVGLSPSAGGEEETLRSFLSFARQSYPEAAAHLLVSGSSGFDEELSVARTDSGGLEIGELARAAGGMEEPWLTSISLESSYGASMSVLYELRRSARYLLASPGPVELRGLSVENFFAHLEGGESVESSLLRSLEESHRAIPAASFALFDLSRVEKLAGALEETLLPLEEELIGVTTERVELRELLFEQNPYDRGAGPLFLPVSTLAAKLAAHAPELPTQLIQEEVQRLPVESWSEEGGPVSPTLYFVSLDEEGTPAGHAGCFLPERPGGEAVAFARSTVWAPRLIEGRGILYFLWYDLLPPGGAS